MNREQRRAKPTLKIAEKVETAGTPLPPICVAIPSGDEWKANMGLSAMAMAYFCGLHRIPLAFANEKGSMLPKNRNNLVKMARKMGCTHILQIDSDLTFPPYVLGKLLSHNKAIVGCTYVRRSQPHDNLAVPLNRITVNDAKGLTEVDRLPTGMLLIKMDVFDKIKKPYFRFVNHDESEEYPEGAIDGEDYYLCDAAKAAGYSVWLDVDLSFELTHWGEAGWRIQEENGDATAPRYALVELQSSV